MNREVRDKWVSALREGHVNGKPIRQGHGTLRETVDPDADYMSLCCLGVLCEIAVSEGVVNRNDSGNATGAYKSSLFSYGAERQSGVLPLEVARWANVNTNPYVVNDVVSREQALSILNDEHGYSFEQIADAIEESL